MKKSYKNEPSEYNELMKNAQRITHPILGIRCWLVGNKIFKNKTDFLYPIMIKGEDGKHTFKDTSIETVSQSWIDSLEKK